LKAGKLISAPSTCGAVIESYEGIYLGFPDVAASDMVCVMSRWREIRACNDNTCGESKGQNSHRSLLDLTCLIAATDPKALMY